MVWSGSTTALEWRQAGAAEYDEKSDKHLRTLFIHGACAVVRVATNNNDGYLSQWINKLKEWCGFNKTTVALTNKSARKIWSMLRNDTEYRVVGS
jgi:hypothetical protein